MPDIKVNIADPAINFRYVMNAIIAESFTQQKMQRIIRPGLQAASHVVRDAAKKNIRSRTGNLRRGVRTRFRRARVRFSFSGGEAQLYVGPPGFHWYVVEFGHAIVTSSGQVVGQVPPHPFLQPALEQTESRQLAAAARALERSLIRELINQGRLLPSAAGQVGRGLI